MRVETQVRGAKNPAALWKWIKRETEAGHVERASLETFTEDIRSEEGVPLYKYVTGRMITITLTGEG